jgi:hypothetical protein
MAGRNVDASFQDERNMSGMVAESPQQTPPLKAAFSLTFCPN